MRSEIGRRGIITGGMAALALGAGRASARGAVTFGLTPVFLTSDREILALLRGHLEAALDRPVRLVLRRTYQEITTMLLAGQLDAAWICGYPFVRHRAELALLAVPVWRGRQLYRSYLIVSAGRAAAGLADLAGDIHAFSDPDSNSGFLVTRSELAAMQVSPDAFFERHFFTYGHRNVVRAVASGLAQSGSVDGYVWEALAATEPALTAGTRVIWRSEWLGFPPVACAREAVGAPGVERLRRALYAMQGSETGRRVLRLLQLDAFAPGEPALFDGIAARLGSLAQEG
ncbi:phosphate/phosphite/phosphonate ABC transporter substrate-binding protein [Paralimibaculum aggregatum]|uniref:Phosphate/phosphite/phosphonate ABC transporter substrate-binding protein n=1 Tax=Paralimibaculum aggregatum TaxID=3036245 RepID=A0ABQ6LSN2_9RHOB|nr:PhnD/SsuA/transferrin family substrate-binding protein [Limibaculum sp. NKW23]GMG85080.1 phosphate/phosphite/phosphonate ABC transporter substrate-binding protein [Limibaculum sp. NKW23]